MHGSFTPLPGQRIVLLGVGHSNAHVLRMWKMRPLSGVSLTCVSDFAFATYSGMLPGVLAGLLPPAAMQIDLVRLCAAAGAELILSPVTSVDVGERQLYFEDRPPVTYDCLSVGLGSRPDPTQAAVDDPRYLPIKPMQTLLDRLSSRLTQAMQEHARPLFVAVAGAGTGGVEVALALPGFLQRHFPARSHQVVLIDRGSFLGSTDLPARAARLVEAALNAKQIRTLRQTSVSAWAPGGIELSSGEMLPADAVLWATSARPAELLTKIALPKDEAGFLQVGPTLQSPGDPRVFAVGDCAAFVAEPLPKAGVYAVRQGPVLFDNLGRVTLGQPTVAYRPQRGFLRLLSTGDGKAILAWKGLGLRGAWCWRLKKYIDSKFMAMYQDYTLPAMPNMATQTASWQQQSTNNLAGTLGHAGDNLYGNSLGTAAVNVASHAENKDVGYLSAMRCTGCGSKVSGDVLNRVLTRLAKELPGAVKLQQEDAALLPPTGDRGTLATTDFFPAFSNDAYLVGRVAAIHAVSDIYARGGRPQYALATLVIPPGPAEMQAELLHALLAGSAREFLAQGVTLQGGHTLEGPNTSLGFTILGEPPESGCWSKGSLQAGDRLILTKPLGTGTLLAAHARAECRHAWYSSLVQSLITGNATAATIAAAYAVRAATDITGFGLAGHLGEMLIAGQTSAELSLSSVPVLPGAVECLANGVESTLAPANRRLTTDLLVWATHQDAVPARRAILFDPQTSGGLLLAVPSDQAEMLVHALRQAGCNQASCVGQVTLPKGQPRLAIVD